VAQIIALVVICLLSPCVVWQAFGLIIFGVGGWTHRTKEHEERRGGRGGEVGGTPQSQRQRLIIKIYQGKSKCKILNTTIAPR